MRLYIYVCPDGCRYTPGLLGKPARIRTCHSCGAERVEFELELPAAGARDSGAATEGASQAP
jgi:hypothetical protein